MLYFFDVLAPSLEDEECRSVACCAVSRRGPCVSILRFPQFSLLCLVDRDKDQMGHFELVLLFDEFGDPLVACQRERVFLDYRGCHLVEVIGVQFLCVGRVAVFRVGSNVMYSRRGCGCVLELSGTSPRAVLYSPSSSSFTSLP